MPAGEFYNECSGEVCVSVREMDQPFSWLLQLEMDYDPVFREMDVPLALVCATLAFGAKSFVRARDEKRLDTLARGW